MESDAQKAERIRARAVRDRLANAAVQRKQRAQAAGMMLTGMGTGQAGQIQPSFDYTAIAGVSDVCFLLLPMDTHQ